MRDIQVSRPVLIALIGAVLVGAYLLLSGGSEPAPEPPIEPQPAVTAPTGETPEVPAETADPGATAETDQPTKKQTAAERKAEQRRKKREKLAAEAEEQGIPLSVWEGLKAGKVVMIHFTNPEGVVDKRVDISVREVKKIHGSSLKVIREKIANKSRYERIAKVAEITQTPGLVMLYGDAADAWQGFIDGAALNARLKRLIKLG